MAYDDSDNVALRERMAAKLADMGCLMGTHEVAAFNNGFPPRDYAAINPASYQAAVLSGEIAMVDTCFAKLASELHDIYGAPQPLSASDTFGSVSIDIEEAPNQPDQQLAQKETISNPFEIALEPTPPTGGSS